MQWDAFLEGDQPLQLRLPLGPGSSPEIDDFQRHAGSTGARNDLERLRIVNGARGPKGFVTLDQFA